MVAAEAAPNGVPVVAEKVANEDDEKRHLRPRAGPLLAAAHGAAEPFAPVRIRFDE